MPMVYSGTAKRAMNCGDRLAITIMMATAITTFCDCGNDPPHRLVGGAEQHQQTECRDGGNDGE